MFRWMVKPFLVVFVYHDVSEKPSPFNRRFGLNVPPRLFSRQMDMIRELFHLVDPAQLRRGRFPTPAALITFDDGNSSYFKTALPILKEREIPSLSFLNLGPIRGEICWSGLASYLQTEEPAFRSSDGDPSPDAFCRFTQEEVARYLDSVDQAKLFERVRAFRGLMATEAELAAAADEPLVGLGNHLYNHYNATLLGDRLRKEYRVNQEVLDAHPRGFRFFSFPFSRMDRRAIRMIREEGADAIFSGRGFANLPGQERVYSRMEMKESIMEPKELMAHVLRNLI